MGPSQFVPRGNSTPILGETETDQDPTVNDLGQFHDD